ncbi:hypothetical protein DAI18_18025 [Microvirgula aerodenitrificans]|uniref:Uncharacterized protein n=1 Tax=Microvirgula aerodenitrificans TaxID=57480 RepID=A0A2S0PEC0_9NEIS|nr:hypothetical protein [Microvirgula aerodenitrificans]AVY95728.1 hypothetical protein DAI18_18025 [Microvirgula aerodenitrificans]
MRDFNNDGQINIQGDFNVNDNSQNQHRLLVHCSSEELLQERPFRQENIRLEQSRKVKQLKPIYGLSLVLFCAAAGWAAFNGQADLTSFILGVASIFLGFQSLKATIEPNSFQIEEKNAINEIDKLLKQRRIK